MLEEDLNSAIIFLLQKVLIPKLIPHQIWDLICTYYYIYPNSLTNEKFQSQCLTSLGWFLWKTKQWLYFAVFSLLTKKQIEYRSGKKNNIPTFLQGKKSASSHQILIERSIPNTQQCLYASLPEFKLLFITRKDTSLLFLQLRGGIISYKLLWVVYTDRHSLTRGTPVRVIYSC